MLQRCLVTSGVLVIAVAIMLVALDPATVRGQSSAEFVPVTDAMLRDPAPADWLMWRRTLDGWGYSPLDQIRQENVKDLQMVWTRALAPGRQEGTPLAYDGVLYMPQADGRCHRGDRRRHGRPEVGASS